MSFKETTREFWLAVAGEQCMFEYYAGERRGWQQCHRRATHVHHILGEAETLDEGFDPNENVGLPLCEQHHVRNTSDEEHSDEFSFHPDMGDAYSNYREWKRQVEHLADISEKKSINYDTSPFADAHRAHLEAVRRGERYIAGTPEIDEYYIEKMQTLAFMYVTETGQKKPDLKPDNRTDTSRRKSRW